MSTKQVAVAKGGMRSEMAGLAMLAIAVIFGAWGAAPEARINRIPLNDVVLHLAASERMETSFERGEPFLDPWVSEWALGYPMWRSYQPLPHVVGAMVLRVFRGWGDPAAIFAILYYLLIVSFPISVYIGARLLDLPPPAAGLASLLAFASSATGDPGRYGLGYGSVLWRGSGLYTQLFALQLMVIAIGMSARALDTGMRKHRVLAGVLLALTALSHIIFGYAAFVSVALLAVAGPLSRRSERLVRLVTIALPALILLAWFVVPLALAKEVVNHSRWEAAVKWDSYGAPFILKELLSGRMLDFGRLPLLSILAGIGVLGAILYRGEARARRLLVLCGVWLALFFGRETWGHLMVLAGVPADLPLHRLQAVFELSAILLTAYGVVQMIGWLAAHGRMLAVGAAIAVAAAVIYIGADRAAYLNQNQTWGEQNLAAYDKERPELQAALADARAILAERPGRVSAGLAATWGGQFRVGSIPIYGYLSQNHFDQPSFLYHSMSKTSDIMVLRDENNLGHDVVFAIRAVIAPAGQPMPNYLRRRSVHGRFTVYEASAEGYFGIVDLAGHYVGPPSTNYETNAAWLKSPLLSWGKVISLDPRAEAGPAIHRWEALPNPVPGQATLRGRVISETKSGEIYQARIEVNQPAYAFVKITWNPDLAATVDGQPAAVIHVTPGFGAVAIPVGQHDVSVAYKPGPLKAILFVFGIGAFALGWYWMGSARVARWEASASTRIAAASERFATPAIASAAMLIVAGIVALHPLFRGKLISGHDATAYPLRVVEMARVVADGHFAPSWAPDVSAGHGQPLFEFSPPLLYWINLPFHAVGFGLTDSIQLSLALLHFLGALAVYGIGRRLQAPRFAALGGAVAWLFGPYLSLDLFVRAAFAEAAAVAVAPIALLALLNAMMRPSALRVALGAAAVGLILLSHGAAATLLLPAFGIVVLAYAGSIFLSGDASGKLWQWKRFIPLFSGAATLAGAVGLTAYFWMPSAAAIANSHMDRLVTADTNWSGHIVWPFQLLWSPWGFGVSVAGSNDGMSFALGLPHIALGVIGFIALLRARRGTRRTLALAFGCIAIAGALLTTYWTTWIWSHVPFLQLMMFPWRALIVPGLFLSLLAIFALERLGLRWTVALLAVLVVINLSHTEPNGYLTYDDEFYEPESLATKGIKTTTYEEYEPRWVQQRPPYYPKPLVGLTGPIEATEISRRTASQEFSVTAPSPTTVESSIFFYPGWTALIDGTPTSISPVPVRGTIQFDVPAGQHKVLIELRRTPVRTGSLMLSFFTLLLLAGAIVLERFRKRGPPAPLEPEMEPEPVFTIPKPSYKAAARHDEGAAILAEKNFLKTPAGIAAIAALLCLGIGVRLANVSNVNEGDRSPDEIVYTRLANVFLQQGNAGVRSMVEAYQRDPAVRLNYPPPTRIGYLWLLAATMRLTGRTDISVGAYLSCVASIGSLLVLTLIGIRFFPPWATLFSLLFFAVSPVELALARRVWGDAIIGFLAFALVFAAAEITRDSRRRVWYFLFVIFGCLGVLIKESGPVVFGLCAVWVLWVLLIERREWKNGLALVVGGFAGMILCITWLAGSLGGLSVLVRVLTEWLNANAANVYGLEYQTGPGYLILEAFWILVPVPALLCLIGLAVVLLSHRKVDILRLPANAFNWRVIAWIALFFVSYLALPMILPHWLNLRYVSMLFGPFYLLAGVGFWYCASYGWNRLENLNRKVFAAFAIAVVLIGAITEYRRFQKVFVRNGMGDLSIKLVLDSEEMKDRVVEARESSQTLASQLATAEAETKSAPSPEKYLTLSVHYHQNARYQDSIAAASEALKLRPDYAEAYNNIAAAYAAMERWDQAIQAEQEALRIKPDFPLARNNLAWAVLKKKMRDLGSDTPEKPAPTPESLLNLSLQYYRSGKYEDMIAACREALKLRPDYAEAYNNIASAYDAMGRWDEAIEAAQQALKLKPDFQLAKGNLAYSLNQKRLKESGGARKQ